MGRLKVGIYGLGSIGGLIAKYLLNRKWAELVCAIDIDPKKAGKDVGEVLGLNPIGVKVYSNPENALDVEKPDLIIHATVSRLKDVYEQVLTCVVRGISVISTCEELAYPWFSHQDLAKKLDEKARENNAVILGTGINPGFLMDTLALVLTTPCLHIRGIYVERVIDSSKRRLAFQKKVGVGLSVDEFKVKVREGGLTCHVGLRESVALIASGLGLKLKLLEEEKPKPVLAEKPVKTGLGVVKPGYVVGVQQVCRGVCEGGINIKLTFEAYAEADEKDAIEIDGEPKVAFTAKPCVHGDLGTAGVILNLAPRLKTLKPGLRTMDELVKTKAYLKY